MMSKCVCAGRLLEDVGTRVLLSARGMEERVDNCWMSQMASVGRVGEGVRANVVKFRAP